MRSANGLNKRPHFTGRRFTAKYCHDPSVARHYFNLKTAMATHDSMPHSYRFSGSGTFGGATVTITGTGATSALSIATFEGQTVSQQTQTTNLTLTDSNGSRPLDGC